MSGMVQFQDLSVASGNSSSQMICLVSPSFIFGDNAVIQYVMIANCASQ